MSPHTAARFMLTHLGAHEDQGEQSPHGNTQQHLLWMLHQLDQGEVRDEKAHRWIGYAQGLGVMLGLFTLHQCKRINEEA